MRSAKIGVVLAVSWAAAVQTAAAAERLVMPYVCTSYQGSVQLDRSNLRSYEIIGPVRENTYTHCAPDNRNRCKTWPIYRFDLDCSGARVPWYSVVAAASELNNGPAFVRRGRLNIRMRPPRPREWQDGPDAYAPSPYGPPHRPRDIAVLPRGFAPIIAMKAEIIGEPNYGRNEGAPAGQGLEWQKGAAPPPPATKPQTANKPKATDTIKPPAPKPAERPAKKTNSKVAKEKAATPSAPAPTASTPGLKILNQPGNTDSKSADPDAKAASGSENQQKPGDKDTNQKSAAATTESGSPDVAPPPPGSPDKVISATELQPSSTETGAIPIGVKSPGARAAEFVHSASGQTVLGLAAIAILTATFLAYLRLNDRKPRPAVRKRDLGAVSLGGAPAPQPTRAAVPAHNALQPTPPATPESEPIAPPEVPPAAPAPGSLSAAIENGAASDWMPTSREDALKVLGASPDASLDSIRKIVDGLRQSWHPDLAKDEADRGMRETRMKLINVAWDVVQKNAAT